MLMSIFGGLMVLLAELLAKPLSAFFVGYDAELLTLTTRAFALYSLSYLVLGVNIFASAFFTALGNGGVSATLSFLRLFVFQIITLLVMPIWLDVDGVWLSIVASELLALGVSTFFFLQQKKKYGY
jgi:Na+-driven multidrug efflux pump